MELKSTDAKFDAVSKLPAKEHVGIAMGWHHPELAALLEEYHAVCAAEQKAELLKWAADLSARLPSAFDDRDENFYL